MNILRLVLIFLLATYCLQAKSEEMFHVKISESVPFFVGDQHAQRDRIAQNQSARDRQAQRNARFVGHERANAASLLRGYSPSMKANGLPYWRRDGLVTLTLFDDEPVYLECLRIYEIKSGVTGWIGTVNDQNGNQIGSATFEIYDETDMRGHINFSDRSKIEIEPTSSAEFYDVLEFAPPTVNVQVDRRDDRTEEQRESDRQVWRDRLKGEEYEEFKRNRIMEMEKALEEERRSEEEELNNW